MPFFVDKRSMAAIMEKQSVTKRTVSKQRKSSSSRHNNKSAVFNTGFMSHFDQKPSRSRNKSPISIFAFAEQVKNRKSGRKIGVKPGIKPGVKPDQKPAPRKSEKTHSSGFSFPIPSVATIAVIAGTVLVALTVLKWEDFNIKLPESYVFQLDSEDIAGQITQYASTGIPSLIAVTTASEPVSAQIPEQPETVINIEEPTQELITFQWQQYKVQKGDAVSKIAKKFGVSIGAIIASNNIPNARRLQEGATLRIPNIDGIPYLIKAGDSLSKISMSYNVPLDVILDINDLKSDVIKAGETIFLPGARMNDLDLRMSLGELFIYPVQNKYITSAFGMRKDPINGELSFHTGIDLRARAGSAVMASMEGVVSVINENWLYGKHIIMSHPNGYKTLYAHLSSVSVKQGDKVAQGRKIGEAGNTGYSTAAHLHFTIYDKNGKMVNPLDLLN
jgi:murein DD-endopeptidase MepM/ murein hydrolase activator NlpD